METHFNFLFDFSETCFNRGKTKQHFSRNFCIIRYNLNGLGSIEQFKNPDSKQETQISQKEEVFTHKLVISTIE
jgi:hypothetical protein